MPRRGLEFRAGHAYHLYSRGVNRQRIFFESENYAFFLRRVRTYLTPETVDVVAYCLMPNHYHLFVCLKADSLAEMMRSLNMSFARAVNKRYDRVGPLFQGRFAAKLVERDEYLLHLSRYIHLNPVEAGLVDKAEAWEYSSYRDFVDLRNGTLPKPDIALSLLGPSVAKSPAQSPGDFESPGDCRDCRPGDLACESTAIAQRIYRDFVESYCEPDLPAVGHLLIDKDI